MTTVEYRVKEIVGKYAGMPSDEIQMEAAFIENLALDSLDLVEVAMDIEDEYRVEIPDEEMGKLTTVKALVGYLDGLLAAKA